MKLPPFRPSTTMQLVMLGALAASAIAQPVLLSEDFNDTWDTRNPPPGWRIVFDGEPTPGDWHRAPEGSSPWEDNPTAFALLDSSGAGENHDSLITPPIDCSEHATVFLRCSTFCMMQPGPYEAVLVGSTGGGPFEHLVFDYTGQNVGPELQVLPLQWAANQPEVQLAWVLEGNNATVPFWALDNVSVVGETQQGDVGVEAILSPGDTVDYGQRVEPQARVRNFGGQPASFWTTMEIGGDYLDSALVRDLPPDSSVTLTFGSWNVNQLGALLVSATTKLPDDINPDNDRLDRVTTVRSRDIGVLVIVVPPDTVDSGSVVTPTARVASFGTEPVGPFWCWFSIPGSYRDSSQLAGLEPGQQVPVEFAPWTVTGSGLLSCACSTWADDINPANDTARKQFFVRGGGGGAVDVAAVAVLAPAGSMRESTLVFPQCVVGNNGREPARTLAGLTVLLAGEPVYSESLDVTIPPGSLDTVALPQWTAAPSGNYEARLTVFLDGDENPANDTLTEPFVVGQIHDVGVDALLAPIGGIPPGPKTPSARIRNYGDYTESFWTRFWIEDLDGTVYSDSIQVPGLHPGLAITLNFAAWNAENGSYTARCSTLLETDPVPANDWREARVDVRQQVIQGWRELDSLPGGSRVKDGGALALLPVTPSGRVYALRGNKTNDFLCYDIGAGWQSLPPVPGEEPVRKGGAMCGDGESRLYVTKGNNTLEFYRYDAGDSGWSALPDIPLGPDGKKVKGGTDLAYVPSGDTGYVYVLKGYKTEFYRFNTVTRAWDTLENAPTGIKDKWDKGSWLVYDGAGALYAHKAKYYDKQAPVPRHEMWRFNIATGRWQVPALPGMPLEGMHGGSLKKKKSKDGGSAAWYDDGIFAIKGGNTQQFFRFDVDGLSWEELDTFPTLGSTGKKKRVKHGADIVSSGDGYFYALKGNKTNEFWRFGWGSGSGLAEQPAGVPPAGRTIAIMPSPAHARARFLPPGTGPALIRLFDSDGRLVRENRVVTTRAGIELDLVGLAPGAYFLKVEQAGNLAAAKLVIE
ncbi:T9SS type A sorting domain-containing protein [candidate division WOR-3 bacterium]|nr:T9SS type A sorting domain-containing protein [candidate division WOR-3 bacterium]